MTGAPSKLSKKALLQHYDDLRNAMTSTGPIDKDVAESAIERLYIQVALEKPAIIWCQSLYQMIAIPSLMIGILHSDIWDLIAGDLTNCATEDDWHKYWTEIWPDIWTRTGMPLLKGMNQTSGISAIYGALEETMIDHLRVQFGKALYSGRLDNMMRKLKRELYRRFWTRLDGDLIKPHLVRLKHDIFTQMKYVRGLNPPWPRWKDIPELDQEMDTIGQQIQSLFDFLVTRLGSEPRDTGRFILHLPAGLPWLATGTVLQHAWPVNFRAASHELKIWSDLANNSSALLCLDGLAFVCEKPTSFHLSEQRRLHNASGPALAYSDGFAEYAWEGVLVNKPFIEDSDYITVEQIETSENVELRRVMLERYGTERYIKDANIGPIQEDECGTLYRRELPGDEALVMVKVINSTPEPDGTVREYFLRVPPNIETARQAVAWTFGLEADDYKPQVQT